MYNAVVMTVWWSITVEVLSPPDTLCGKIDHHFHKDYDQYNWTNDMGNEWKENERKRREYREEFLNTAVFNKQ